MARLTPLSAKTLLLEAPRGDAWSEHLRGSSARVLAALERDPHGSFHGLGSLALADKKGERTTQQRLCDEFGVPLRVAAEPRAWYARHREPTIVEADRDRDRVLVRFEALGPFGSFHGTCLYACVDGEWGCFTIRPSASAAIATAEAWLARRGWEDWG
jgi:hypothetical protein